MPDNERERVANSLEQYAEWCEEQGRGIAHLIEIGAMPAEDGQQMISNLRDEASDAKELAAKLRSRR